MASEYSVEELVDVISKEFKNRIERYLDQLLHEVRLEMRNHVNMMKDEIEEWIQKRKEADSDLFNC